MKKLSYLLTCFFMISTLSFAAHADLSPEQIELATLRGRAQATVNKAKVAAMLTYVAPNGQDMDLSRLLTLFNNVKDSDTKLLASRIMSRSATPQKFADTIWVLSTIVDDLYQSFQTFEP